ncbi:MAG: T9SS type A sorting domain-containing protein [Bacteroidota bacterium]
MKIKQLLIHFVLIFSTVGVCTAQTVPDTIKVMTYNVGDFGTSPTSSCPLFDFNLKSGYLRTILNYTKADIIGMVKMNAGYAFCTDTIMHYVLDSLCPGCWENGVYSVTSTYSKANMLYFNTHKLGFISSTIIYNADPNISDIILHKLYYKAPNLTETQDTVYLKVVLAHLKSGSGSSSDRATELAGAMSWLNAHISSNENIIFMGDLNTTKSDENCFQYLINSTNSNTKFYDPPNQLGNWSNSSNNYAYYLTQSTRTSDPGDCNAVGGINDRFDHILLSSALMNGTDSLLYISGSYKVIGQDGNHTGIALTDAPTNTSVPANVNTALYYFSEHLPVMLSLLINNAVNTGIASLSNKASDIIIYPNPATSEIKISAASNNKIEGIKIFNMIGKEISFTAVNDIQSTISMNEFSRGIYFIQIIDENKNVLNKKIILQ